MWILILTLIVHPMTSSNITTSISTVPVTFNDYNTCMDAGKQWATEVKSVKSAESKPTFVCVKHYANSER